MSEKRRYAIVGTGGRSVMFINGITGPYQEHAELVGFCDLSQTRMNFYNAQLQEKGLEPLPTFPAEQFDQMVQQTKPDVVIVTTMDATHHQYIIRALELGCDAITEKPMTTDGKKARAIFDAIERTGGNVRVTFNYRYSPNVTKVKELLMAGTIGQVTAVDFSWVLDTRHGADYFRRWHATKANSGGLLIHKATHHFDIINWWLDEYPQMVFALGDLKFYGRKNAEARGESYAYDRYTGEAEAKDDPFALDLTSNDKLQHLYRDAEADSGYVRDKNVFGDHVDIEDTMALTVRYRNNVIMNYSLLAYSPWEGFRVALTGTKGRIELFDQHGSHIIMGQDDKELAAAQRKNHQQQLKVYPMFGMPYDVEIPKAEGGHGGADPQLMGQLFEPDPPTDPYHRNASHLDGAASLLIGASANESIRTGQPVQCDELLPLPPKQKRSTPAPAKA